MFIHNMEAQYSEQVQHNEKTIKEIYNLYNIDQRYERTDIRVSVYNDRSAFFQWMNYSGEFAVNLYNFGTYVKTKEGRGKFIHEN
jgi:hypothetical protein